MRSDTYRFVISDIATDVMTPTLIVKPVRKPSIDRNFRASFRDSEIKIQASNADGIIVYYSRVIIRSLKRVTEVSR